MEALLPIRTPAAEALLRMLAAAQRRYALFPQPQDGTAAVVVGVSGGADSVCLLYLLAQLAETWRLELHVAHLDHGLRVDSAADSAFVAGLAASLRLPCHLQRLPDAALAGVPGGREAAAREARYAFLGQVAINVTPAAQVPLIAVAHHADDQAETLLLHLARGSGAHGLGAMRPKTPLAVSPEAAAAQGRQIVLVRPLLNVRREALRRCLGEAGLTWREDSTNADTGLTRNYLRHQVMPALQPLNPRLVETLARTAEILADEAERLVRLDEAETRRLAIEPLPEAGPAERIVLDLASWRQLDRGMQRGVLRLAIARLGAGPVDFARLEALIEAAQLRKGSCGPHPLTGQICWTATAASPGGPMRLSLHLCAALPCTPATPLLDPDALPLPVPRSGRLPLADGWQLVVRQLSIEQLPPAWRREAGGWHIFLAADDLGGLVLTVPRPGLRFAPLGMSGQHKSLGDLFTDTKTPRWLRSRWPLLVDPATQEVLWVCGLRLAQTARLLPSTQRVLELVWERQGQ